MCIVSSRLRAGQGLDKGKWGEGWDLLYGSVCIGGCLAVYRYMYMQ